MVIMENLELHQTKGRSTMRPKVTFQCGWLLLIIAVALLFACAGQRVGKDPELAKATRSIGEAYMNQGDLTAALRELLKAEQLNPDDPIVHNDLGLCYMLKKRMPDAIAHFKKAIDLKPGYAPARNNLGTAYLEMKEWDAAIEVFKEITQDLLYATPHYPLANLGLAYYHKGQYRTAMRYYKKALEIQPDFANALRGVGRIYLATNQGRLALKYLQRAVKVAPKAPEIHYDLGEAYLLVGQYREARSAYLDVVDLAPPESEISEKAKQRLGALR
jgi:tetratricopeptide (TPR) repeat protein